ncbi:MAG: ferrous iron transport protein B [Clostridia bacterium]|nr:ferrous iron transport protein B [Clostridia bacterium]
MKNELTVGFIGNPNCGKTTLFNAYTGAKLKVANWPGVTVEKKEGVFCYHQHNYKLVDLPGIYSLTSYTLEEKLSRRYILEGDVDVIINVVDASCLERNLFLTLQLIELGKPVVLALNMMDIVEERGMEIDLHRLPEMLGIPVVPVCARKKKGIDVLMHTVSHHQDKPIGALEHQHAKGDHCHDHHSEYPIVYSDKIEDLIDAVTERICAANKNIINHRWYALKVLEHDSEIMEELNIDFSDIVPHSLEKEIINQKYDFIEEIIAEVLMNKEKKQQMTDKIDLFLTHPIWGMPIFFGIMALIFFLTFSVGDLLAEWFSFLIDGVSSAISTGLDLISVAPWLKSLIVDGIIAGVGGILTFLPNIFILFLCLSFLEDSGYMSRVAYVMDSLMGRIGLSGRAFIPMLLGFGCTVPALMAARTLENKSDKLRTILVTPFMSCSARLPVYVLFSQMFFPKNAMLVAYSMYIIGPVVAIIAALIMWLFTGKEKKPALLIELPEYKTPNGRSIAIYVWEKVKDYLTKAGTTIFIASVILWFLLNFNFTGLCDMNESFAASIGKLLSPVMKPVGLSQWQIVVALISGIAAKEVVVSSCGVLFGIPNINSAAGIASFGAILTGMGFTGLNAFCLMLFCLLYSPCAAAIATLGREANSQKWAVFSVVYQTGIAWLVSFLVFQIGSLF